jgi:protein-tyrosine phosphatase
MQNIPISCDGSLHIGARADMIDASHDNYDTIITVDIEPIEQQGNLAYHWINMSDAGTTKRGSYNAEVFAYAADTLVSALRYGHDVAIHCFVGRSRSVGVAIAAVAVIEDIPFQEALDHVTSHRPQANVKPRILDDVYGYIQFD